MCGNVVSYLVVVMVGDVVMYILILLFIIFIIISCVEFVGLFYYRVLYDGV